MEDQFGKINCKKNVSTNMFIPMLVIEEVPGPRIFLDPFGSLPAPIEEFFGGGRRYSVQTSLGGA
jgi:hypothetical protein